MMRIRHVATAAATALALLSLGACQKEGAVAKDESVDSVAKKIAAADVKPQAGRWESSMKMLRIDLPGVPPEAKAAMDKQLGVTQTFATCLTPAQVSQPGAGFFQKGVENCKYDHFVMADGKIDAQMSCMEDNRDMKMTMAGTYNPTTYAIQTQVQGEMAPGKSMTMEMAINSTRVGECNGSEEK